MLIISSGFLGGTVFILNYFLITKQNRGEKNAFLSNAM
jgi:hypothetical protein